MKDWGIIVRTSEFLRGTKVAYKFDGNVIVSPAIASLMKDANEDTLRLIVGQLAVIDLDNNKFSQEAVV